MYWISSESFLVEQGLFNLPLVAGLLPLLIWSLLWNAWALWLAARRGERVWFVVLLLTNTLGLLEIFYIFVIAKQQDVQVNSKNHE